MPLGMMQHSTAPSGFFGAISISAIAVAEKILDLVDDNAEKNSSLPCLDKNFHEEKPVIFLLRVRQISLQSFLVVTDILLFQDCVG